VSNYSSTKAPWRPTVGTRVWVCLVVIKSPVIPVSQRPASGRHDKQALVTFELVEFFDHELDVLFALVLPDARI
jgi:hypothetical protein